MREIKYRAKGIATGQWYYGFYSVDVDGRPIITEQKTNEQGVIQIIFVDPKTIVQFTGLHDKNGKEIWEGDIVRGYEEGMIVSPDGEARDWRGGVNGEQIVFEVRMDNLPREKGCHCGSWERFVWETCEVIGNIYENPNLLSSKKE